MAGTNIVCQTCGNKGFSDLLTSCIKCRISAIHCYCLDKLPEDADEKVIWTCDECTSKDVKVDTCLFRKSQHIGLIKEKNEARKKMKRPYRKPPLVIKADVTRLAELTQLTDELSDHNENVPRRTSINENNGIQEMRRQRRLILSEEAEDKFELSKVTASRSTHDSYDDSSDNSPSRLSVEPKIYIRGEPVNDRIWSGHLNVRNHIKGLKLAAHMSNLACPKVKDAVGKLPKVLNLDIFPKDDVWPKSFGTTTPTDQSIALYFLPEYETEENGFDMLLEDMINKDLALKTVVANAELLIFTSCELTTEHWRLGTKYYLWAVFRQSRGKHILRTSNAIIPLPTKSFGNIKYPL